MAALTDLTLAQLKATMDKKEASAVEVAEAHLRKLDEHRALNAFITETPERAREMAKASDARRAKGEAGLLEGVIRKMANDSLRHVPFTQLANLTGTPAISLPLHWTADGLPLGVQFQAAAGGEGLLLQLAAELEAAQPWFNRVPPELA